MPVAYDPRRPDTLADPWPVFHRLQAEDPVHWSEILGGWVLTRYADVKAALNDPRFSADRITPFARSREVGDADLAALLRLIGLWAVFTDPPTHTRLRGLMNLAFTSRAVERVRPRVTRIVDELLAAMDARGGGDLIRDFAYPLPVAVIADMLGVPREDGERFKARSDELATFIGSAFGTPDKYARAARSAAAMADYFRAAVAERRTSPSDDFMSALRRPGTLRYDGPTQAMVRVAADEVEIGGTPLPRGARIFTMINAANRDPEQFPDPDRLDVRREHLGRHIGFGYGIHFCLGAPLVKRQHDAPASRHCHLGLDGFYWRTGKHQRARSTSPPRRRCTARWACSGCAPSSLTATLALPSSADAPTNAPRPTRTSRPPRRCTASWA